MYDLCGDLHRPREVSRACTRFPGWENLGSISRVTRVRQLGNVWLNIHNNIFIYFHQIMVVKHPKDPWDQPPTSLRTSRDPMGYLGSVTMVLDYSHGISCIKYPSYVGRGHDLNDLWFLWNLQGASHGPLWGHIKNLSLLGGHTSKYPWYPW